MIKEKAGPEISRIAYRYMNENDFNIASVGMDEDEEIISTNQKTNIKKKF